MGEDRFQSLSESVDEAQSLFDQMLDDDESEIDLDNTVLADALKNQIPLQMRWEELYNEIDGLCEQIEAECERIFSITFKELAQDSYKNLSFNEAKIFAQSDPDYVDYRRLAGKAKTIRAKIYSTVDTIKSRRYLLKNLCDALRDSNDKYII